MNAIIKTPPSVGRRIHDLRFETRQLKFFHTFVLKVGHKECSGPAGRHHTDCDTFVHMYVCQSELGAVLTEIRSGNKPAIAYAGRSLKKGEETLHGGSRFSAVTDDFMEEGIVEQTKLRTPKKNTIN